MLILLAGSLTLILQRWVGGATIYQQSRSTRRAMFHDAILHNRIPPPYTSWQEIGANRDNVRIATVYFVESLHRMTKWDVLKIYEVVDTVALFLLFLLSFVYLRGTSSAVYALCGILYLAAIMPLTYFNAVFHPWDRVSLLCWIALLILLRSQRLIAFTMLLAVSITVKFDTIVLPALYLLANVSSGNWFSILFRSAGMFGVALAVLTALRILLPGGFEDRTFVTQLTMNFDDFRTAPLSYPPFLAFVVPVALALMGLRLSDRFSKASVLLGVLLFVPFLVTTNFIEVRAELPVLVLLLPSVLTALRILCASGQDDERDVQLGDRASRRKA